MLYICSCFPPEQSTCLSACVEPCVCSRTLLDATPGDRRKRLESLRTIKITTGLEEVAMRGTRMNCLSRIKSIPGVNPATLGWEQLWTLWRSHGRGFDRSNLQLWRNNHPDKWWEEENLLLVGNDQCSTPVCLCLRCHTRGDFFCTSHREQSQTHLCHWVLEKLHGGKHVGEIKIPVDPKHH